MLLLWRVAQSPARRAGTTGSRGCYDGGVRVDVLCFGVLKDFFGGERDQLELPEGTNVAGLLAGLQDRGTGDVAVWKTLAVAVNREYAGLGTVLQDGDEVALLPPVSGGRR